MSDHPVHACDEEKLPRQQHGAKLFLKVIWVVVALGGWLYFLYDRVVFSSADSSAFNVVKDDRKDSGKQMSFYDQLDQCVPCGIREEKELVHFAPGLIIPGAQKAGTSFLLHLLGQHPDIADFRRESHILDNSPKVRGSTIHQCDVWRRYEDHYSKCKNCGSHQFFIDKSPKYLWMSHKVPKRLACVFPHPVKILVLLRNPTQRAFSQYQMRVRHVRPGIAGSDNEFLDIVSLEREKLEASGLSPGLEKEAAFKAWKRYHDGAWKTDSWIRAREEYKAKNITDPEDAMPDGLSRGLYAVQLTHWIDTLSEVWRISHKDLLTNYILIVDNDDIAADTHGTVDRILAFVGLPPYEFQLGEDETSGTIHNYTALSDHEREFLDEFFRPYNADLHRLLEPHGIEIGFAKEAAMGMS